jgi:hypothetical protein
MMNMSPAPGGGEFSPDKRRLSKKKGGSFIGGSFIGGDGPAAAPETEEQKAEREKKEMQESFSVLSKEDSRMEMKRKDFDEFFTRTSRIMERALDNDFDVVGDFFADDDEETEA